MHYYFDETSGRMTMMYGWTKMPVASEPWNYMSIYPKFYESLHVGSNTFTVYSHFSEGITVIIEMDVSASGAAYISTFFPMNPVNEPIPLGEAFMFFDQLTIEYGLLTSNVTMTIILPPSMDLSTMEVIFYAYNMSGTEEWDPAPPDFYIDSVTYNYAENTIILEMPTFPFGLISAMAYIDTGDGGFEIPGYDIFLVSFLVIIISGIVVKKIRKKK